jgi:hypothetical protein
LFCYVGLCHYVAILITVNIAGPAAIVDAIKNMGAMTSLDLASNRICLGGQELHGIKAISSAIKVLAVILVPFLSPSDISFNLLVFAIIHRI